MSQNPLDLLVVLVLLLQFIIVSNLLFLSREQGVHRVAGMGFPKSDVSIFTAAHYVFAIHRVQDGINPNRYLLTL